MKKIIGLTLLATLTLAGCSAVEEPVETAAPTLTETSEPEPAETNTPTPVETEEPVEAKEQGEYLAGIGEESYNPEDKAKVLGLLSSSCDVALKQGAVESFDDSHVVLFAEENGYQGYTAFYETPESADLVYSLDYFFVCFLPMDYSMFQESGESDLDLFPISVAEVSDEIFQVKYDLGDGSYYTSQYKFKDGLLYEVVSNPEEEDPFTFSIEIGEPSESRFETLKTLVDALDEAFED